MKNQICTIIMLFSLTLILLSCANPEANPFLNPSLHTSSEQSEQNQDLHTAASGDANTLEDLQNLSWLGLIASNVAPRQVIIGEKIALGEIDVNNIMAIATHEGEVVPEGLSKNVLGDQWSALHFLVEKRHERGYHIKTDDVVITGAMGPMFPAMLGPYEIDYDDLGLIEFDVIE